MDGQFDSLYSNFAGVNGVSSAPEYSLDQIDRSSGAFISSLESYNNVAPGVFAPVQIPPAPLLDPATGAVDQRFLLDPSDPAGATKVNTLLPYSFSDVGLLGTDGLGKIGEGFWQEQLQINGGGDNAFVTWSDNPGLVMGRLDGLNLAEGLLGQSYTICDNFFHSAFGGVFLNHQFLIADQPPVYPGGESAEPDSVPVLSPWGALALDEDGKLVRDGSLTPIDGKTLFGSATFGKNYVVNSRLSENLLANLAELPGMGVLPSLNDSAPTDATRPYVKTIGDALDGAGVSWKWYSGGWTDALNSSASNPAHYGNAVPNTTDASFAWDSQPFAYFDHYAPFVTLDLYQANPAAGPFNPFSAARLQDESNFFGDVQNNTLPAVCFIKPLGTASGRPGYSTLQANQDHVNGLITALQANPSLWAHTAVIIAYSSNGGHWDHVAPPYRDEWGPGTRVPCLLVSPFAKRGLVDHQAYDTSSLLSLLEERFHLPPLTTRDLQAVSLDQILTNLQITRGGFVKNRRLGLIVQSVTVTNISSDPIGGPIYLALDNLSSSTALVNGIGATNYSLPSGSPYVLVSNTGLAPGASVVLLLKFTVPTAGGVAYYSRTFLGAEDTDLDYSTLNDGIPDAWKRQHGFSVSDPRVATLDFDRDGLTNLQEYNVGTDPRVADTDGDGYLDGEEVSHHSDPNNRYSLPQAVITLSSGPSSTKEGDETPGTVTVSRDSGLQSLQDVTVYYTVSGTAAPGLDYAELAGVVTIPAGSASANIDITAFSDFEVEGDETVIVSLDPSYGYTVGDPNTATVTILDQPVPPAAVRIVTEAGRAGHHFLLGLTGGMQVTAESTLAETGPAGVSMITASIDRSEAPVVTVTDLADGTTAAVAAVGAPEEFTWTTSGNLWLQADGTPARHQFYLVGDDRMADVFAVQTTDGSFVPVEAASGTVELDGLPADRRRLVAGYEPNQGYRLIDLTTAEAGAAGDSDLATTAWTPADFATMPLRAVTLIVPDTDLHGSFTVSANSSSQWLRAVQETSGGNVRTVIRASVPTGVSFTLSRVSDWAIYRHTLSAGEDSVFDARSSFPALATASITVRAKVGQDHRGPMLVRLGNGGTIYAAASTTPPGTISATTADGTPYVYQYFWYEAQIPADAPYLFTDATGSAQIFDPLAQAVPATGAPESGTPLAIALAASRIGHTLRLSQAGSPDQALTVGDALTYTEAATFFLGTGDEQAGSTEVAYAWIAVGVRSGADSILYDDTAGDSITIHADSALADLSQWRADVRPRYFEISAVHWAHRLELHNGAGQSVPLAKMAAIGYWQPLAGQSPVFRAYWQFLAKGSATEGYDSWIYDLDTGEASPANKCSLTNWDAADSSEDLDGDGLPTWMERLLGLNPNAADTDGDGVPDGVEVTEGLDPTVAGVAVSVTALNSIAISDGSSQGLVRFSRTAFQSSEVLVVSYQVSGTAVAGTDYAALPGSIKIPAGVSYVDLTIGALPDAASTGPVTIELTASASPGYGLLSPYGAALTIFHTPEAGIPERDSLRLWLRANDGLAVNPDGSLDSWWDASGTTEVSVPDAVTSPTLVPHSINGLASVHFDGATQYYALSNSMGDATEGEFFVVQRAAGTGPSAGSHRFGSSSGSASYPSSGSIVDDFGSATLKDTGTPTVDLSQFHIYNVSSAPNSWVSRIDGLDQYSTTTNTVAFSDRPTLGYDGNFFEGDVAEVLVFAKILQPAERRQVMVYLAAKYALTASHPLVDSDGDGLPDWWEVQYGFNIHSPAGSNEAGEDPDQDGFTNLQESRNGTDPWVNNLTGDAYPRPVEHVSSTSEGPIAMVDSDRDGISDADEALLGTDPHNADSDHDGIPDARDPNPTVPNPPAPTDFSIVVPAVENGEDDPDATHIQLRWTCASPFLTGFRIEKLDGANGWSTAATLGSSAQTWDDMGLLAGRQYAYRVRALGPDLDSSDATAGKAESLEVASGEYAVPLVRKYSQRYSTASSSKSTFFSAFSFPTHAVVTGDGTFYEPDGPISYYTTQVRHEDNDFGTTSYDGTITVNTYGSHLAGDYSSTGYFRFDYDPNAYVESNSDGSMHVEQTYYRGSDFISLNVGSLTESFNSYEHFVTTEEPDKAYLTTTRMPHSGAIDYQAVPAGPLDSEQFWSQGYPSPVETGTAETHLHNSSVTQYTNTGGQTSHGNGGDVSAHVENSLWSATNTTTGELNGDVTTNTSTYSTYIAPWRLEQDSGYYHVIHDQIRSEDQQAEYTIISRAATTLVAQFKETNGDNRITYTSTSTLSGLYPTSQLINDGVARLLPYSDGFTDSIMAYQEPTLTFNSAAGYYLNKDERDFSCAKARYRFTFNPSVEQDVHWFEVFEPAPDFTLPPEQRARPVVIQERIWHVGTAGGDTDVFEIDPTTRADGPGTYSIAFSASLDGLDASGNVVDETLSDNTGLISYKIPTPDHESPRTAALVRVNPADIAGATYSFGQTGTGLLIYLGAITVNADGTIQGDLLSADQEVTLDELDAAGDLLTIVDESDDGEDTTSTSPSAMQMTTKIQGRPISTTAQKPMLKGKIWARVDANYDSIIDVGDVAQKLTPRSLIVDVNNLRGADGKPKCLDLVVTPDELNGSTSAMDYSQKHRVEPLDIHVDPKLLAQLKIDKTAKIVLRLRSGDAETVHIFNPQLKLVLGAGITDFDVPLDQTYFTAGGTSGNNSGTVRFWIEGRGAGEIDIEVALLKDGVAQPLDSDYVHIETNAVFQNEDRVGTAHGARHRTGVSRDIPGVREVSGMIVSPLSRPPIISWTGKRLRDPLSASLWVGVNGTDTVNFHGAAFTGPSWAQAGLLEKIAAQAGVPYSTTKTFCFASAGMTDLPDRVSYRGSSQRPVAHG